MSERQVTPPVSSEDNATPQPTLSTESMARRETDEQQTEYLAAYRQQLRRMACPGCGDGDPIY